MDIKFKIATESDYELISKYETHIDKTMLI